MNLKILDIKESCTGCGACSNICPRKCIIMKPDEEGFFYPTYDSSNCIDCGLCEKTCHIVTSNDHKSSNLDNVYMYQSYDDDILQNSSSGGAFTLFANWILEQGGVVYGSRYNGDYSRLEVIGTDKTSLESLRKSKYLESYTGNSFFLIRKHLKENKKVLYCGTPCQIRGLKQYLKKTNTNTSLLLTIDFACHGVPSNYFFNEFKKVYERKKDRIIDVDFRYKNFSRTNMRWHNMTLRFVYSSGKSRVYPRFSNYYYYYEPFLDNLFLRRSCYQCDIAIHSDADITLGDFWGIHDFKNDIDNNKGLSFVCFNNDKFKTLLPLLSQGGFCERIPENAISYQYVDKVERKLKLKEKRNIFVKNIIEKGYYNAVNLHYGKYRIIKMRYIYNIRCFIKNLIGKE